MPGRFTVWDGFRNYAMKPSDASMDQLCRATSDDPSLQTHQRFLQAYASRVPEWRSLMLYHGLGSGKTITAIVMAETFLQQNPRHVVRVILPARLRTNFTDELQSSLATQLMLTESERAAVRRPGAGSGTRTRIDARVKNHVRTRYDIMSLEKFAKTALTNGAQTPGGLGRWCREFTQNALLIVDEAHNVMSSAFDENEVERMREEDRLFRIPGFQTALMLLVSELSDPTSKLLCLTGTPIFDNLRQLELVVQALLPGVKPTNPNPTIADWIALLRGRVSYFPGSSPNAYPTIETTTHSVPASALQAEAFAKLHEDKDPFMSQSRQISLALSTRPRFSVAEVVQNLSSHAPKIARMLTEIDRPGKHVVYCSFVKTGVDVVRAALQRRGWLSWEQAKAQPGTSQPVFAVWDGTTKDDDKREIKRAFNQRSNMDGSALKLVVGSPSLREGVSFKHVQHLHLLDPVWNPSTMEQIQGRAVRFCSHVEVPVDHPVLRRHVILHRYRLVKGAVPFPQEKTSDELLYDSILVDKKRRIGRGERALRSIALDRYLFEPLYHPRPKTPVDARPNDSPITFVACPSPADAKRRNQKKRSTCPPKRRPDADGNCPPGQTAHVNKHGDLCCFKRPPRTPVVPPAPPPTPVTVAANVAPASARPFAPTGASTQASPIVIDSSSSSNASTRGSRRSTNRFVTVSSGSSTPISTGAFATARTTTAAPAPAIPRNRSELMNYVRKGGGSVTYQRGPRKGQLRNLADLRREAVRIQPQARASRRA